VLENVDPREEEFIRTLPDTPGGIDHLNALITLTLHTETVPVAPGVRAWIKDDGPPGEMLLLGVLAEVEGSGDVGRWLDALPRDRKVAVPNVTSERLAGMLERRGFRKRRRYDEHLDDWLEVWVR